MFTLEFLYAWAASTLLLSWLFALCYPLVRRGVLKLSSVSSSQLILIFSLLPVITVSLVLLLYSQPRLNALLVYNHCHGDVCGPHWVHLPVSSFISSGVVLSVVVALVVIGVVITRQLMQAKHYGRVLQRLSHLEGDQAYRVVESDKPLAWCAGMWKPEIYISRGLLERLDASQLKMVWAHEHCHARHKDNVRKTILHWATLHWPPQLKRLIRRDFTNQIELSSDLAAVINQNDLSRFEQAIQLISTHCSREDGINEAHLKERAALLRHERDKLHRLSQSSLLKNWLISMGVLSGWLVVILGVSQILHPLLELLSQ